ncbi:Hypothetical protein SLIV_28187 [Streptomyces lividans TK24]|uniref:Uncharacterized protein n=1 Tax=Streptomyces lividans TK24 TaxID=457428 RepID=A0ABX6TPF8_STRLI|nr:Hypothetical protein SLIV_28187 [Streptomyces lividans TK24]QSJ12136.1 Hypothetical protein SLIVDG2_28187 [Streptomyces lividans]QTD73046.1 Hypothetical protein SLIVYQS_28187 [Streptomyces lividans TK24] [Streptomyces lividans]
MGRPRVRVPSPAQRAGVAQGLEHLVGSADLNSGHPQLHAPPGARAAATSSAKRIPCRRPLDLGRPSSPRVPGAQAADTSFDRTVAGSNPVIDFGSV